MLRQMATVGSGTSLSRALGFLRDVLLGALLGAGTVADAFFASFQIVIVARRLIEEGALNATLVPAYLRAQQSGTGAAFAGRMLGSFSALLFAIALIIGFLVPAVLRVLAPGFADDARLELASTYARWIVPYLAAVGPVTVIAGLLNAHRHVMATAFAPVMFNVVMIFAAVLVLALGLQQSSAGLLVSALIGLAGFAQLAVLIVAGLKFGIVARPIRISFDKQMRAIVMRSLPAMASNVLPQATVVLGAMFASEFAGGVSWLYFANRLTELPLGLVSAAMGTVLTPLLTNVRQAGADDAPALQWRAIEIALGLTLPAAIGLGMLAQPIATVLFRHGAFTSEDARQTAAILMILAAALPGHALVKAMAPAFFARDNVSIPFLGAAFGLGMATLLAVLLTPRLGLTAVAIAVASSGWTAAIWLAIRNPADLFHGMMANGARRALVILASGAIMAAALAGALALQNLYLPASLGTLGKIALLAIMIGLGMVVYGLSLTAFGVVPWRLLRPGRGQAVG